MSNKNLLILDLKIAAANASVIAVPAIVFGHINWQTICLTAAMFFATAFALMFFQGASR